MQIDLKLMKIGYINVKSFPNRNQSMINMLEAKGLNYFRVEAKTLSSYDPIAISHVKALDAGADVILEDDCVPTSYYRDVFEVPDDADVVYLGISTGTSASRSPKFEKISDKLYRLNDMTSLHAVLYVTEAGRDWLRLAHDLTEKEKTGFDISTARLMNTVNVYGLNKPIWYQLDVPNQTNLTLDEALLLNSYEGGAFVDYPEPIKY